MQYDSYRQPSRYNNPDLSYSYGNDHMRRDGPVATPPTHSFADRNIGTEPHSLPVANLPLYELPPEYVPRSEVSLFIYYLAVYTLYWLRGESHYYYYLEWVFS